MPISDTAVVSKNSVIGMNVDIGSQTLVRENVVIEDNVTIGDFCIINENVRIKSGSFIESFSIIGEKLGSYYKEPRNYTNKATIIGSNSIIRSHSIIYSDVEIGKYFQSGHRITLREGTVIGNHSRIGTLCDVQGDCTIGDYVSLHSNVHIGQKSTINDYVWIFPYVVLTNDPTPPSENIIGPIIDSFAIVATGSVILPGIHIGADSLVGAQSLVRKDVAPYSVVGGNPAKVICSIHDIKDKKTGEKVYPWREHFTRGMPWETLGYEKWLREIGQELEYKK